MIKILIMISIIFPFAKSEIKPIMYDNEDVVSGYLSGYNQGVMEESINYYDGLNMAGWCGFICREEAELDGFAVVAYCERVGDIATLKIENKEYTVLVADCIAQEHIVEGNIFDPDRGYILELDYDLFQEINVRYGTLVY